MGERCGNCRNWNMSAAIDGAGEKQTKNRPVNKPIFPFCCVFSTLLPRSVQAQSNSASLLLMTCRQLKVYICTAEAVRGFSPHRRQRLEFSAGAAELQRSGSAPSCQQRRDQKSLQHSSDEQNSIFLGLFIDPALFPFSADFHLRCFEWPTGISLCFSSCLRCFFTDSKVLNLIFAIQCYFFSSLSLSSNSKIIITLWNKSTVQEDRWLNK